MFRFMMKKIENILINKKTVTNLCFKNKKAVRFPLFLISLFLIFMFSCYDSGTQKNTSLTNEEAVEFADINLEKAVREELDIPQRDITEQDMLTLTSFKAVGREIESLDGLEYATNLERLWIKRNAITDISPLAGLTDMKMLWLTKNDIADITPLKRLNKLSVLQLRSNNITNLSALGDLTNLEALSLSSNDITDISPLADLTNLITLSLSSNDITEIAPLVNLTSLKSLRLNSNTITDITPLAELTDVKLLMLNSNSITDISSLRGLANLEGLLLNSNTITDISPLIENEGLTSGDTLRIKANPLDPVAYYEHIPELENRGLRIHHDKPGEIQGSVVHSRTGEGLEGVTVYLDVDHDSEFDDWEVSTTSSSNGTYSFKPIGAYNYQVRINTEDGKSVKSPAEGYYTVDLSEAEQVKGKDFGLAKDF